MISGFFVLFLAIVMLNVISRNKKRGDRSSENWVPPSITPDENCSHDHHNDAITQSHHHSGSFGSSDGGGHHG